MNTEPENLDNPQPAAQPAPAQQPAQPAPATQPAQVFDPRRRLRELLSVPERDRTDEQWDEINELEIQLAPGNRIHPGTQASPAGSPAGGGRHFQQKKHLPKGDKGVGGGGGGGSGGGGGGKRRPRPSNPNK